MSSTLDFDFYHLDSLRRDFLLFFAFGFVAGWKNKAGWHTAPDCTGVVNTLPGNKAKCVECGVWILINYMYHLLLLHNSFGRHDHKTTIDSERENNKKKKLVCWETIVDKTPEGALLQNDTASTHTREEKRRRRLHCYSPLANVGGLPGITSHSSLHRKRCVLLLYSPSVLFVAKHSSRSPPSCDCRRVASVALVSSISTRKNEFQHARHSGDKCFAEHHVGTNEDSVWIPWKHRGA